MEIFGGLNRQRPHVTETHQESNLPFRNQSLEPFLSSSISLDLLYTTMQRGWGDDSSSEEEDDGPVVIPQTAWAPPPPAPEPEPPQASSLQQQSHRRNNNNNPHYHNNDPPHRRSRQQNSQHRNDRPDHRRQDHRQDWKAAAKASSSIRNNSTAGTLDGSSWMEKRRAKQQEQERAAKERQEQERASAQRAKLERRTSQMEALKQAVQKIESEKSETEKKSSLQRQAATGNNKLPEEPPKPTKILARNDETDGKVDDSPETSAKVSPSKPSEREVWTRAPPRGSGRHHGRGPRGSGRSQRDSLQIVSSTGETMEYKLSGEKDSSSRRTTRAERLPNGSVVISRSSWKGEPRPSGSDSAAAATADGSNTASTEVHGEEKEESPKQLSALQREASKSPPRIAQRDNGSQRGGRGGRGRRQHSGRGGPRDHGGRKGRGGDGGRKGRGRSGRWGSNNKKEDSNSSDR